MKQVKDERVDFNSFAEIHQKRFINIANSIDFLIQLCLGQLDNMEDESKSLMLVISRLNFCKQLFLNE